MTPQQQINHRQRLIKEKNDRNNPIYNPIHFKAVNVEDRDNLDYSGLSEIEKMEAYEWQRECWKIENADRIKEQQNRRDKHKRWKHYRERLDKKNKKEETHLLCASTYISRSEAFHQYDDYDAEVDKERLRKIFKDEEEVDHLQKVNEYAQKQDFGGWVTKPDGKTPATQKIHKDMDGDYYICPYCTAQLLPAEVEMKSGYRFDCCHKGTMRTLIELEKRRPESKFAKYLQFLENDLFYVEKN